MTLVNTSRTGLALNSGRRSFERLLGTLDVVVDGSRHLLTKAARKFACGGHEYFIPRYLWFGPPGSQIEGMPAHRGMVYADIYNARDGALRAVPGLDHPPFEITLATPRAASVHWQVEAHHAALAAIL